MQTVEKLREITQHVLSLDEIRLCRQVQKLVDQIPDTKIRFPQIDKLWETYKTAHPNERDWTGNAKADISAAHFIWVQTLHAHGSTAEELFVMIQNYIKQADASPLVFFSDTGLWIHM